MDYVIVGGGIYGTLVAWELARRGAEVLLLEANEIAGGASGGLGQRGVRGNGRDARELPLMALSYERWPVLHEELGGRTGYDRQGHLLLIERERDLPPAETRILVQNQLGVPSHWLSNEALYEIEPDLRRTMRGAVFCPLDGIADHTATTRAAGAAAEREGATVREHCQVASLELKGGRVSAVTTAAGERLPVQKQLLLLNNVGAGELLAAGPGLKLPVYSFLPQVMLTQPVQPMPVRHLIGHAHRLLAVKNNPDGRVMISGGWRGRFNPATGRNETRPDQVAGNLAEAQAVYPALEGIGVSAAAADRPETVCYDGIPLIDRVPGVANAIFATGWSGHGWAIAPATTRLLAEWAWTDKRPELLAPFGLSRFGVA